MRISFELQTTLKGTGLPKNSKNIWVLRWFFFSIDEYFWVFLDEYFWVFLHLLKVSVFPFLVFQSLSDSFQILHSLSEFSFSTVCMHIPYAICHMALKEVCCVLPSFQEASLKSHSIFYQNIMNISKRCLDYLIIKLSIFIDYSLFIKATKGLTCTRNWWRAC